MQSAQALHRLSSYRGAMSSVDAHHAANAATDTPDAPGTWGSVDAHHAAGAFTDTTVALMSYNLGINKDEVVGKHWPTKI